MTKPLESEFRMIVPTKFRSSIKESMIEIAKRFGGVTTFPVEGAWVNSNGKIIKDANTLLFTTRDLDGKSPKILIKDRKFLKDLAKRIAIETGEDEIWIEEDIIRDVDFIKNPRIMKKMRRII